MPSFVLSNYSCAKNYLYFLVSRKGSLADLDTEKFQVHGHFRKSKATVSLGTLDLAEMLETPERVIPQNREIYSLLPEQGIGPTPDNSHKNNVQIASHVQGAC